MKASVHKRLLSILLVLTLLVSLCPAAFAAAEEPEDAYACEEHSDEFGEPGGEELSGEKTDSVEPGSDEPGNDEPGSNEPDNEEPESEVPGGEQPDEETDSEEPGGEQPGNEEPGDEEPEEQASGDEPETGDEVPARVLLHVVSAQPLTFVLKGAGEEIAPASEEELAAWYAAQAADEAEPADETAGEAEADGAEPDEDAEPDAPLFSADYLLAPGSYTWSASAAGLCPQKDVALELTAESTLSVVLDAGVGFGFRGMPEGWEPSAEELEAKQALIDHDVLGTLADMTAGVDYIEGEVCLLTDSEEYARTAAEAYSAELLEYAYGVATLRLSTAAVPEAVMAGADPALPLPPVEANRIVRLDPDIEEGRARRAEGITASAAGMEIPTVGGWRRWYESTQDHDTLLRDPTYEHYQYMHDVVNSYDAWELTRGAGVTVAVIDSGVYGEHEEFQGCVDYLDPNGLGQDELHSHGTHVAGIVAAQVNNGTGGAGIAPEAQILSVRVFDKSGSGSTASVVKAVKAVVEAKQNGDASIRVINMSLGGDYYDYSFEQAIRQAVDEGITVVVSMGNDSTNAKSYPAGYNVPGLIAVGSTDESGSRSYFSNYGAWEDVLAPGSAIMAPIPGSGEYAARTYGYKSGTSMSAPVVAGVCALYLSVYPEASPVQVESAIKAAKTNGVIDASKLFARETSAPVINADASVPYGAEITFTPNAVSDFVIYTTDGRNPTVRNGMVTVGSVLRDGAFSVAATTANGFAVGRRITIKAACVSRMGIISKTVSKTVTVGHAKATGIVLQGTLPSRCVGGELVGHVVAGKSVALPTGSVQPAEANQKLSWSIEARDGCPGTSVTAAGVLKTKASDSGTVTLRLTSAGGEDGWTETYVVAVRPAVPVRRLSLNSGKAMTVCARFTAGEENTRSLTAEAFAADGTMLARVENGVLQTTEADDIALTWSSSNPKVATVDQTGVLTPRAAGSTNISCAAADGSNVRATIRVSVVQLANSVSISGANSVAPGKTVAYTAAVGPSGTKNRSVIWSLEGDVPAGVSINAKNGRLSVARGVADADITIRATAADGYADAPSATKEVHIRPQVTAVKLYVADDEPWMAPTYSRGVLSSVTISSISPDYYLGQKGSPMKTSIQLGAELVGASGNPPEAVWSSSNERVATVDQSGRVEAVSAGTATIRVRADDAGGKTAGVTVRVINPASSVTVASKSPSTLSDDVKILGVGKSVGNTVRLGDDFGRPSTTKVSWSRRVFLLNSANVWGSYARYDSLEELEAEVAAGNGEEYFGSGITVNASGTVSAKRSMSSFARDYFVFVWVQAATTDGSALSDGICYLVLNVHTKLSLSTPEVWLWRSDSSTWWVSIYASGIDKYASRDYTVKCSNPNIVGAYVSGSALYLYPTGEGTGTATVTIKATDGSGKSASLKVRVKD